MENTSLNTNKALYEELVPGGGHTSFILKKDQVLRITDIEGNANVSLMMLNANQHSERLNLPDTLKAQHTAKLTVGHCLYSDMGRVLAAITADTCGWHDSFGGVLNAKEVQSKYGNGRYQELRNSYHRNGTDNFLVEMGKWNLDLEDLLMVINFFSKVAVDDQGYMFFEPNNSCAGDYVELYAPMDTLVILTPLQHPLDPNPEYLPRPVQLTWREAQNESEYEVCRQSRPENGRAFQNTERLYLS